MGDSPLERPINWAINYPQQRLEIELSGVKNWFQNWIFDSKAIIFNDEFD